MSSSDTYYVVETVFKLMKTPIIKVYHINKLYFMFKKVVESEVCLFWVKNF